MSDWLMQSNYMIMILQVFITLVLVPLLSIKKLVNIANHYGLVRYPNAKPDVEQVLITSKKSYWTVVIVILSLVSVMVGHAITQQTELLNWDDQSGLMLIYLLSMIPVIYMTFIHRKIFYIFKKYAGSKRSASLKVRTWKDYISTPYLLLIITGNLVYVATVLYFVQHPFVGFAGLGNIFGLIALDVLFMMIIIAMYKDNKTYSIEQPEYRFALKKRAIHINMLILAIAVFHVSLSMWVQGTELVSYKIIIQSVYFQLMLVMTAFALTLPKSIYEVNRSEY